MRATLPHLLLASLSKDKEEKLALAPALAVLRAQCAPRAEAAGALVAEHAEAASLWEATAGTFGREAAAAAEEAALLALFEVQAFFVGDAYLGEDAAAYPTAQLALLARLPPALCAQLKQRAEARPRASWSLQAAALNAAILYTLE